MVCIDFLADVKSITGGLDHKLLSGKNKKMGTN